MNIEQQYIKSRKQRLFLSLFINLYLMLVLLGIFAVITLNAGHLNNYFKEKLTLTVYFKEGTARNKIKAVEKQLKNDSLVKSVIFISKEKAAEKAKQILGQDFINVLGENPLQDNIELHFYGQYVNDSIARKFKEKMLQNPTVDDVVYEKAIMHLLNRNIQKIGMVILIFGVFLFFIIYFAIRNTVKLSVYNKRFTIKTMQLVGASEGFIMRPFLYKYSLTGFLAGLLAAVTVFLIFNYAQAFLELDVFRIGLYYYTLLAALVLFAVFISLMTSFWATRSILRMNTDDIHYA